MRREKSLLGQLFGHLLEYEYGYLRYDHDEEHASEKHPQDHLDVFYNTAATFKVGLKEGLVSMS